MRRSLHTYQKKRSHKKIFRQPQYKSKKKIKWPVVRLKEVMMDAGIFVICEDDVKVARADLMKFYFRSKLSQKRIEKELTSKSL